MHDSSPHWLPANPVERPRGRRGARNLSVLLLVIGLIGLAVWVGDWVARTASVDALVDEIERSESAMATALAAVSTVVAGQESADGLPPQAAGQLQEAAAAANGQVTAASAAIEKQQVQPWHGDVLQARESYLAHSLAWQDFLSRAATDASTWFVSDPEIERTWNDVTPLLFAMVPTPALPSLSQRVAAIVDSGDEPSTGPTLQAGPGGAKPHPGNPAISGEGVSADPKV